ncbi:hypothetical protein ACQKMI_13120 [Lysinibacillus sp. NPDC097214]|uniref:hypothetical protein n=1 Tax=Lysinibacillus sp. NPDC097214 TaxID=3390584 RepID=UPI003D06DF4C
MLLFIKKNPLGSWYNLEKKGGSNLINFIKPVDFIFILAFTLLFVLDYFPNIPLADSIPKGVLIALILGLFIFSLIFKKDRDINNKEILQWQIFLTIYILLIMGILTILGGQSSSGIAFDNGVFWIVLLISLFDIYSQYKKFKRTEA